MSGYRAFDVPVPGGELAGGIWNPDLPADGPTLVAVHGITASHLAWELVAAALPGTRVVAPDLRGRGRSSALPGPYGLTAHADDLARTMDALGIDRAPVAGHSMGAFVAVRLAERHPDRVERLVLIDGGLPLAPPAGIPPEDLPAVVLGPALQRLRMRFATADDYRAFWRAHPAIGPWWNDAIERYVDYDLVGVPPELRSSASEDAVAVNALELDGSAGYADALAVLTLPISFLRAPRGLLDADPLYDPAVVADWAGRLPQLRTHEAVDVNHYTIVMTEDGVRQVLPLLAPAG
ncbi:alpha/beta hydrolase [Leifsonia aquatica]|uniref:alpha/beta hydrolase n=1 Tax=Leifsonia aquatica TaxID=144185 RepID=UPI0005B79DFB|nr:alpha/beta hydrolase [Leifsonia aquatica]